MLLLQIKREGYKYMTKDDNSDKQLYKISREHYKIDSKDDLNRWLEMLENDSNFFGNATIEEIKPDGKNKTAYLLTNANGNGVVITQELYHFIEAYGETVLKALIPYSDYSKFSELLWDIENRLDENMIPPEIITETVEAVYKILKQSAEQSVRKIYRV